MTDYELGNRRLLRKKNLFRSFSGVASIAFAVLLVAGGIFLILKGNTPNTKNIGVKGDTTSASSDRTTIHSQSVPDVGLDTRLDSALYDMVKLLGVKRERVKFRILQEQSGLAGIYKRKVRIHFPWAYPLGLTNFIANELFRSQGCEVVDVEETIPGKRLVISAGYNGFTTHIITLDRSRDLVPVKAEAALLIMGFGNISPDSIKPLLSLGIPYSAAVVPFGAYTKQSIELLDKYGRELLVALPLEPRGYPEFNPGRGTILLSQSDAEIERRSREAIEAVPNAIGICGYKGQVATADRRVMGLVMREIKKHPLFYIDPRTASTPVGVEIAASIGILADTADIVLDDNLKFGSDFYWDALLSHLSPQGVIFICDARGGAGKEIALVASALKKLGINFVPVSEILERRLKRHSTDT